MGACKDRVLTVNLTDRVFSETSLGDEMLHDYVGGRGFGAKFLYDDLEPGIDPLDPRNELVLVAGPLAGTNAQCFGRWKAFFKSPLTGTYFMSSGGGHLAAELKFAGFDAIIITGASEKPVYLWVHDGRYELRDASNLWGLNCDQTHTVIREELGDSRIRVACVGPAGENLVRYAGIFSDRRAAGRGGGGAVMGAKKLKAIALRGHEPVVVANPELFSGAVKEQIAAIKANPAFESFSESGTQGIEFTHILGLFPVKNFREGFLPNWEMLEKSEYDKLRVRKTGCYACMIHCGNVSRASGGDYAGASSEGPEYETIWAFSGPILLTDTGLTIAADRLCDDLGLDTISTGVTIGFAYELYEKGIIGREDTDGLELTYGNGAPVMNLIAKIARREGFGEVLADGVREAARRIGKGAGEFAIHVKGLELPGYDPRGAKAQGLNLLTSNIGADHNSAYAYQEIFNIPIPRAFDRLSLEGKGELAKYNQDMTALMSTGILCAFTIPMSTMSVQLYGRLLSAATGINDFADMAYLRRVGERIFNLERMFNIREGFSRKNDIFPRRISQEPLPNGSSAGQVFEIGTLLADYYQARGWDPETGIPTLAKLNELGLEFTIKDIRQRT